MNEPKKVVTVGKRWVGMFAVMMALASAGGGGGALPGLGMSRTRRAMRRKPLPLNPLAVACTRCGAAVRQACSGKLGKYPHHLARVEAAKAAWEAHQQHIAQMAEAAKAAWEPHQEFSDFGARIAEAKAACDALEAHRNERQDDAAEE